jgi:glycosyltransferase involved in cell wall biosynthesis
MSINSKILATKNQIDEFILELNKKKNLGLKIGYIGNIAPQGYSKGVEDLIKLSQICQTKANHYEIVLIGCTLTEKKLFDQFKKDSALSEEYLKCETHLSHTEALRAMKTFDVLVLPVPQDRSYVGMPLKLLEYLAAGRITIIAESKVTTSIFQDGFKPYYYIPGNPLNLFNAIDFAISDLNLKRNISLGVNFASQFTWRSRTEKMLSITLMQPSK